MLGGTLQTASLQSARVGIANGATLVGARRISGRLRSDGFHESGGEGFGLRADANISAHTQVLGDVSSADRWRCVQLGGYAEWQQVLSSEGLMLDASFIGVDAWAPLRGMQPACLVVCSGSPPLRRWVGRASCFGYDQRVGDRGGDRALSLRYSADF